MEYKGKHGSLTLDMESLLGHDHKVYCDALNLGGALTADNVRTLLKWKSPRWLSPDSDKVEKVLARLDEINSFRAGRRADLAPFFGGSGVYDVFIKHIARPTEYPIYDRHVLNAYYRLEKGLADGESKDTRPELYEEYRAFFFRAYDAMFGAGRRKNDLETVNNMKMLDHVLMEYDRAHGKE